MIYLRKFCKTFQKWTYYIFIVLLFHIFVKDLESVLHLWGEITAKVLFEAYGMHSQTCNRLDIILFYHLLGEAKLCNTLLTICQELVKSFMLSKIIFSSMKITITLENQTWNERCVRSAYLKEAPLYLLVAGKEFKISKLLKENFRMISWKGP